MTSFWSAHLTKITFHNVPELKKITEVKFVPADPMKACREVGGIAALILDIDSKWRWMVNITPRPLYTREIKLIASWDPEPLWTFRRTENLMPLSRFESRNSIRTPYLRHYTDWPLYCIPVVWYRNECRREHFRSRSVQLENQQLPYTRVGTLIVATIYLQLIQNRYMFRSFTVLHCSHQHCVRPVASDVEVVGYL